VAFGQGYHLGRPLWCRRAPCRPRWYRRWAQRRGRVSAAQQPGKNGASIRKLLHRVAAVSPEKNNNEVYDIFLKEPKLMIIPVVDDGVPLGLISRFE
jgi:hypothetical protein